ncbi:GntR family transcriptional regulator [Lipingzhangella sp. LS1_29]|uniref:GntR family transcriptional regulator n=1 Tax=Lipingzhangella rawalii TaxID=2055835 RepID=A0ABU2HA39_9ACTN|nr:GntR family transcriptional regulator [Lipingzhangella rawalii]MDS1272151.1 GntR family transcriptional regulator [Lipingzhangella rawalii]
MNSDRISGSKSKRDWVAESLRARIGDGSYAEGARLPTEEVLAEEFEISRNTVRDAMKVLQNEGLVVIRHGSGTYVRNNQPIVHLATSVHGYVDSERFQRGYAPHMRAAGYDQIVETVEIALDTASGARAVRLGIDPELPIAQRQVVKRICDRFVEGQLWQRQVSHFPATIAMNTELSIPQHIERGTREVLRELGYERTWSYDLVSARMPSPQERQSFGTPPGLPLIVQDRIAYSGEQPISDIQTVMPADRHQLLYAEGEVDERVLVLGSDVTLIER